MSDPFANSSGWNSSKLNDTNAKWSETYSNPIASPQYNGRTDSPLFVASRTIQPSTNTTAESPRFDKATKHGEVSSPRRTTTKPSSSRSKTPKRERTTVKRSTKDTEPRAKSLSPPRVFRFDQHTFSETIRQRLSKKLLELPVHKDIARLAKQIKIVDITTGTLLYAEDGTLPHPEVVKTIFLTLARRLDTPEAVEDIEKGFARYVKPTGDLSVQLRTCFEEYGFDDSLNWVRVVKCIQQEMIFPAVSAVRMRLYEEFPYKDIKGSWRIIIEIHAHSTVVTHRKWEQAHSPEPEKYFRFFWLLRTELADVCKASIWIRDYVTHEEMPHIIVHKFEHLISPFVHPTVPYFKIWRRQLDDLPVGRDLPRLCTNLVIYDNKGEVLAETRGKTPTDFSVAKILLVLTREIQPRLVEKVQSAIETHLSNGTGDVGEKLTALIADAIPEKSRIGGVLKCLCTHIIYPAILELRNILFEVCPFKDFQGSWEIQVIIKRPKKKNTNAPPEVTIIHRKAQQAKDESPKNYFKFEWTVALTMDYLFTGFESVRFEIKDYSFGEYTGIKTRKSISRAFRRIYKPGVIKRGVFKMSKDDLLNVVIEHLKAMEHEPVAFHTRLPHSLPISHLLEAYRSCVDKGEDEILFNYAKSALKQSEQ